LTSTSTTTTTTTTSGSSHARRALAYTESDKEERPGERMDTILEEG
jgi:hypothetical protein